MSVYGNLGPVEIVQTWILDIVMHGKIILNDQSLSYHSLPVFPIFKILYPYETGLYRHIEYKEVSCMNN